MNKRMQALVTILLIIYYMFPNIKAEAATAMKMNVSSKTLYLNENNLTGTSNTYDFSIKNKGTNYKAKYTFKWYADDDSIVKVTNGGIVTAKKVGKTRVKCDVRSKSNGKLHTTVFAEVTVKANAETVVIKNSPENNQISIGGTFDYNRTMKAANGGVASDKTEWFSSNPEVATVNNMGVVTGLSAGTTNISCKTYQSATAKDLGYTAESLEVKLTVLPSILSVTAVSNYKIKVCLNTDVSGQKDLKDNIVMERYGKTLSVNNVSLDNEDKTGKTIIVTTETKLDTNITYNISFTYKSEDDKSLCLNSSFCVEEFVLSKITLENHEGYAWGINHVPVLLLNQYGFEFIDYSDTSYVGVLCSTESVFYDKKTNCCSIFSLNHNTTMQIVLQYMKLNTRTNNYEMILENSETFTIRGFDPNLSIIEAVNPVEPIEPQYLCRAVLKTEIDHSSYSSVSGAAIDSEINAYEEIGSPFWDRIISKISSNEEIEAYDMAFLSEMLSSCYNFYLYEDDTDISEAGDMIEFSLQGLTSEDLHFISNDDMKVFLGRIYVTYTKDSEIMYQNYINLNLTINRIQQ